MNLNYILNEENIMKYTNRLKEVIDYSTWKNWKVNYVHHIEYFFDGDVDYKNNTIKALFESEGFDIDVDIVEDKIKKAVRSQTLGNLNGTAIHIAHNSVGNRIDLVFNILFNNVVSYSESSNECIVEINGDIFENDEIFNFGFKIYLVCKTYNLDFTLVESKKSARRSLNESKFKLTDVKKAVHDALSIGESDIPWKYSDDKEFTYELENYLEQQAFDFEGSFHDNKYGIIHEYSDGLETIYLVIDSEKICTLILATPFYNF